MIDKELNVIERMIFDTLMEELNNVKRIVDEKGYITIKGLIIPKEIFYDWYDNLSPNTIDSCIYVDLDNGDLWVGFAHYDNEEVLLSLDTISELDFQDLEEKESIKND